MSRARQARGLRDQVWMLWPPYRHRMRAIDAWCEVHRNQIAAFAHRVAQLGYTVGGRS